MYLVSYDLITPGKDYKSLISELESFKNHIKPLRSVWFIKTNSSREEVWDRLVKHLDKNDKLYVLKFKNLGSKWRNFSTEQTNWLKENS